MKKSFSSLFLICVLIFLFIITAALPASAAIYEWQIGGAVEAEKVYSGTCGAYGYDITWSLDAETGVLTITGEGEINDYNTPVMSKYSPWYPARTEITSVVIGEGITVIGMKAFYNCRNLETVTLPESLKRIEDNAFLDCYSLDNLYIHPGVESIDGSFENCLSLKNVYISDLEAWAKIDFNSDWGAGPLSNGAALYLNGEPVTSVTVDFEMSEGAFAGCSSIQSVVVTSNVSIIPDVLFAECANFSEAYLADGVTVIGQCFFYRCPSAKKITIPSSVKEISYNAFDECDSLTDVYYDGTEEEWNNIRILKDNDVLETVTIHFLKDIVKGDANGDGQITTKDVMMLKKIVVGEKECDIALTVAADINNDGKVSAKDILFIRKYLMNIISELPV